MKKIALAALLALFAAVPGMAVSTGMQFVQVMESPEMDPALVDDILKAAALETEWSFQELRDGYDAGVVTIDKVTEGYRVSEGGNILTILLEDAF